MLAKTFKPILFAALLLYISVSAAFAQAPDTSWTNVFGDDGYQYGRSVQQTTDGGYIIAGQYAAQGGGGSDFYLVKTDSAGTELWSQTYGGSASDYGYSVQQTTDGGYIMTGYTNSFGPGSQAMFLLNK